MSHDKDLIGGLYDFLQRFGYDACPHARALLYPAGVSTEEIVSIQGFDRDLITAAAKRHI